MIENFFHRYFVEPIFTKEGYNIFNTITYFLIFIFGIYLLYKIFKKFKLKFNFKFLLGLIPIIFAAAVIRVLEDLGILPAPFFVTPMIWVIFILYAFFLILIGIYLEKRSVIELWKFLLIVGVLTSILPFFMYISTPPKNYLALIFVCFWYLVFILPFLFMRQKKLSKILMDKLAFCVLAFHLLDGTSTFVALEYNNLWVSEFGIKGYFEQHVFPRFLINYFGAWIMVPLKLVVVLTFLILIFKYCKDKNLRNYLMVVACVLGLGPGLRDFLRLLIPI